MIPKDIRPIVKVQLAKGWRLEEPPAGRHPYLVAPNGRRVTLSGTSSCDANKRVVLRYIKQIERAAAQLTEARDQR